MPAKLTNSGRQSRYVFGRLNLIANYNTYDEKYGLLSQSLRNTQSRDLYDFEWSFADIEDVEVENDPYIYGVLVKSADRATEVLDKRKRQLSVSTLADSVVAKSRFFLNVRTGIIAFQTSTEINVQTFTLRFRTLVAFNQFMVDAEIKMIEERNRVFENFTSFDRIMRVSVTLHPSNPSSHDLWKEVDKRIQGLNATTVQEVIDGKKESGGLNIDALTQSEDVKAKLAMAEDGYGQAVVSGTKDGKRKTISTGKKPKSAEVPDGGGLPQTILNHLKEAFTRIINTSD